MGSVERAVVTVAIASIPWAAACRPVVEHRDFIPSMPGMMVDVPGDGSGDAARHVVPPDAVDERSAVLVYTNGADIIDDPGSDRLRTAELRMQFRARNDERVPLTMEPQNALLIIEPEGTSPEVVTPAWIEPDDKERTVDDGSIVVSPSSTASWTLVFMLPPGKDPLRRLRSFLVSWTYRLGAHTFEERTRFVAVVQRSNGWTASNVH